MTTLMMTALFVAAGLLAAGTLAHAWNAYRHRFAELNAQLRIVESGIAVQFTRRNSPAPVAAVYQMRFTPRAECLPYRPEMSLPVAA